MKFMGSFYHINRVKPKITDKSRPIYMVQGFGDDDGDDLCKQVQKLKYEVPNWK